MLLMQTIYALLKNINEEKINEAIKLFIGKHDFEIFS